MTVPKTYTHNGKTLTIQEWSAETGLSYGTIYNRLSKSWPIADVLHPKCKIIRTPKPRPTHIPFYSGKNASRITYQGKEQTITQWVKELGLDRTETMRRFQSGSTAKQVLGMDAVDAGVGKNFRAPLGTGGGTSAQETPNLTFQMEAA